MHSSRFGPARSCLVQKAVGSELCRPLAGPALSSTLHCGATRLNLQ